MTMSDELWAAKQAHNEMARQAQRLLDESREKSLFIEARERELASIRAILDPAGDAADLVALAQTTMANLEAAEQRAERAEADTAALRKAADEVRIAYNDALVASAASAHQLLNHLRWPVGHLAIVCELHSSGAALLTELHAARAYIEHLQRPGGENDLLGAWLAESDRLYDAYNAARTTNSEEDTK